MKPDNILLLGDGSLVLADFGLGNNPLGGGAMTNSAAGTPGYAAPELYQGSPFSSDCDLYSVGATGFNLLTGQHPKDFSAPLNPITMDPVEWVKSGAEKTIGFYAVVAGLIRVLTDPTPEARRPGYLVVIGTAKAFQWDLKLLPTAPPPPPSKKELGLALLKLFAQATLRP